MGNTKYTYAVARIRALEVALFSDAVIEQLLSCKTAAEALQFVVEKGWGDMADQDDPDVVLRREEEKTWEVIKEVAPDASVFNVLSYPKLYHNLKAAIKEVCTEARNPNIFYDDCPIPGEEMLRIVENREFSRLPSHMGNVAQEALETLLHTRDGQLCDIMIDKAALEAIRKAGKESGEPIIENYADTVNLLKKIGRYKHNHVSLVLSERTPAHETAHLFLRDIMLDDPFEIDLNELTDKEVELLIQVVEKNGLWQKRSHFTVDEKIQFIKTRCKRHLSQFIIQLVKSDDLGNRYNEIVTAIKHRSDYYQALLYLLIGAVLDFRLRLVDIVDDLGLDSLNNISFRKNKFLREFIDFDTEEIVFKSSILSNYILKNLLNYSDIDTPLIQIYERLHEKRSHKRIRKYLKEIMLYQNLNRILKKDSDQRGLNRAIFNIYEKVAYLEYNRENPLFWLQFAIARLADGEYSDAARCFDNAYSYAKNTNFDTFQIDNHFARYLLEDANEKKNVIEPIEVFKRAHRMLMASQKGNQYKHYSFRVARHYSTFYSIYHKDFSFHERYDFFIACHEMLDAVEKYLALPGASKKDMVEETRKQLEELLMNDN